MKPCSLYSISFPNGKQYIGVTERFEKRMWAHRNLAKTCRRFPISNALRKYKNQERYRVLAVGHRDYILDLEVKAIAAYQTRNIRFGYNVALGGGSSPVAIVGHTKKSRAKMSTSQRLRKRTPEELDSNHMSALSKRRVMTDEYKQKLREAAIRRWSSKEAREEQSARLKNLPPDVKDAMLVGARAYNANRGKG